MSEAAGRRSRYALHVDGWLVLGVLALCVTGLVVLYSAAGEDADALMRQGLRMAVGFAAMLALAQVPPREFARWAPWLYVVGVVLLVAVMAFGTGRGAQRWLDAGLFRFQPSEMMKLTLPLAVARFLASAPLPPSLPRVLGALMLTAVPVVLVAEQPDLGTALLIAAAGAFVLFLSGIGWRYIGAGIALALAALPLGWMALHDYQRQRVLTMFDPESDPLGAGYHIIQSKIAVGSGGLYGKGWLNGTQSHLEFIPERSTDFIFAVFCEEFGFVGVLALLAGYTLVVARGLYIAACAQETFGRLIAGAVTLVLFIYVFVNMSMVIGQLPVVGVPLPLISYGGTSLVTLMAGFGILMSVHTHRRFLSSG